ncbi:vanillate O-demethylase ferredoxin subunit [Paraburkholderia sp. HC6.4b]|uniref:PDR/VanB family oxidoreductase n=1 Tax=unclassified Paraburkholderia TaxID=2615204 RepID=UPI0016108E62|nr:MULTISPECIES: PDR/VanB family oxidoreductase [unclassified Paraburkholderia]MBB5413440.1 vanillate O-demethylase ferredoxin subunit [Paraburkholderia sp. HC6.4b]MBB5455721.1 vanillate O-demethylase ferredoxin subunit [Paraburkholderia sp. Kb1A]
MNMTDSTLMVRVAARRDEADGIAGFELVDIDGRDLPPFEAGAHIDVYVPGGPVRQYSLCNASRERHRYQIAVLRAADSRGGSQRMHDAVNEGDAIRIGVPRNHFPLARHDAKPLLLAGGIGVTPILCMAEQLAAMGAAFEMHYCARSKSRAAFVGRITASSWAGNVQYHFDDAHGVLDLNALLTDAGADRHLYVCGPLGFMNAVLDTARSLGWSDDRLHYEYFAAAQPSGDGASFDVRLARSDRVVSIAADCTVTQALAAAGVDVPVSCEQGICGTCVTRVLEGEPDHRDLFLSPEEQARNDQFLPCCSRAKSRVLVLDL